MEGQGEALLGQETATKLEILKIDSLVNNIETENSTADIINRHKDCFEGIGKLKDFQLKIPIDPSVKAV